MNELLNPESGKSFFVPNGDGKYAFISRYKANDVLTRKGVGKDSTISFTPRFYLADYLAIYYTLHTLNYYKRSLSCFIKAVFDLCQPDDTQLILKLLFALHTLGYEKIPQLSINQILDNSEGISRAIDRSNEIIEIFSNKDLFEKKFLAFNASKQRFQAKRVTCTLRDFLKCHNFSNDFKRECSNGYQDHWQTLTGQLNQLELPGDVWNNNTAFRKCLFPDELNSEYRRIKRTRAKEIPLNMLLRFVYEHYDIKEGYPEQFDATFDFVPRMCEKGNCQFCDLNMQVERKNLDALCIAGAPDASNIFCPPLLYFCGYKMFCNKICNLKNPQ